jgi:DNA recombination protein RmuC
MQTQMLTPELLAQIQTGAIIVLPLIVLVGIVLFMRRLNRLQQAILHLSTDQQNAQNLIDQRHISTEEQIRQLQVSQASTQTTVTATQQEMHRRIQDLTILQRDVQNLMREIKTQHADSRAFMAEWKQDTMQLSRALRTTYQQGIWGELELRRVVELAGMQRYCDFDLQKSLPNKQTPDMLIHLHNNRTIAVDSKANSQVYLNAMDSEDETTRAHKLKEFAREVKESMNELAKKEYWKQLQPTLALVILFIPNEAMFRAALQQDINLLELATEKNILLASPVTLIALLKALAYGWSQEERAQHVQQIVDQSKELHKELELWLRQWQPLKKAIYNTTLEFNRAVDRYDKHVLPLLHALGALDSTLRINDKAFELKQLAPVAQTWSTELPPEEETSNGAQPAQDAPSTPEQEKKDASWQDRLTRPLKKLQALLPFEVFSLEKEEEV